MTGELPAGAAIIVLGASGAALGQRVRELLPGAQLYGPRGLPGDWDETYDRVVPLIAELFAAGEFGAVARAAEDFVSGLECESVPLASIRKLVRASAAAASLGAAPG